MGEIQNVIVGLCHILERVKSIPVQFGPRTFDLRDDFAAFFMTRRSFFAKPLRSIMVTAAAGLPS